MQHGFHINILLQFFFSNKPCKKTYARNAVGTVIYSDKCGKTAVRETVDAKINNVIYMELWSPNGSVM
jgi:hypothetical protein